MHKIGVVLLFSGGVDSVLAAAVLKRMDFDVHALSICWPTRPSGEIAAADLLANRLGIDIYPLGVDLFGENDTLRLPYRNMVFWSIAAAWAAQRNIWRIAAGHVYEDAQVYPDASLGFFDAFRKAAQYYGPMQTVLPVWGAEYVRYASFVSRDVLEMTWSCWKSDGKKQCGACEKCEERAYFFEQYVDGIVE